MLCLKSLTEHLRHLFIKTQRILNDEEGRVDAVKELRSSLETRIFALIVALSSAFVNTMPRGSGKVTNATSYRPPECPWRPKCTTTTGVEPL